MADETTQKMETVIERTLQQQTKITSELRARSRETRGLVAHFEKSIFDFLC
ncbi:MAG: hypothetical protein GY820_09300 [Gammaproteobacteria bacterium]|nr:hypothetical protein [Gammaproteobacteria bacterium]